MSAPGGPSPQPAGNRLLAGLPRSELHRLRPHLKLVSLTLKQVLYEPGEPIRQIYFPTQAVLSLLTMMRDGTGVEIALVGGEGMVGVPALLRTEATPHRVLVQYPGEALRVRADVLRKWAARGGPLGRRLSRYISALLTQLAQLGACNGLHTVRQRFCRWLLMSQERARADVLPLTHGFLALMLGVRKASVTEVAGPLQEAGLIRCGRGEIEILDRRGVEAVACECNQVIREAYDRLLG